MELDINFVERFEHRHNGSTDSEIEEMLSVIGVNSLDQLIDETIPDNIRLNQRLALPSAMGESLFLDHIRKIANKNQMFTSLIGAGYYGTITPAVIQRNILENPGWYTAYTPYQAEISQGRLEALLNYQTMIAELTGMELANASLLDEGTAAAEAMYMLSSVQKGPKKTSTKFFVDKNTFPQTVDVMRTRASSHYINLEVGSIEKIDWSDPELFGIYLQNPGDNGHIRDLTSIIDKAHEHNVLVAVGSDLMSLVLMTSPGKMGADVVVGNSQRFGVPMGYGGPHAGFFATRSEYKRQIPGRIIGVTRDARGREAYRMALQTREQHIKRERATSNICTAQVLLAVMAGMYAVYHGKNGLRNIAKRIHGLTRRLDNGLKALGIVSGHQHFFDTIHLTLDAVKTDKIQELALDATFNFRYFPNGSIGISLDETCTVHTVESVLSVFASAMNQQDQLFDTPMDIHMDWPSDLIRKDEVLTHPVFNSYQTEHEMLRYLKRLENKDISLTHSMISLGSCTMKLNGTSEMIPVAWPEFASIHPFVPVEQAKGYQQMIAELQTWLATLTGFAATSLQPNSGAQGEYSGLMVIKAYHKDLGQGHRNVVLIPSSAHGTNPASAVMSGSKVVIVGSDDHGNIDIADLKEKAKEHKDNLMALMVTYPSTHGVYESAITEICRIIHEFGGQVYMDGANMNAQVGLTSPGTIGADVCHLNLHKTFAIPHGGGGPGIGPICVAEHLAPFLPGNVMVPTGGEKAITAVSSAPWGSADVLVISYAYIAMMGVRGLENATKMAILNANYVKARLEEAYPVLYKGEKGRCAHEMIVDFSQFKANGIEVEDVAKRLMDYGYHAPTVSFPVHDTLMIEPTESESKAELDRFCEALLSIRKEIKEVSLGEADALDNVFKNAPHTAETLIVDTWERPYSREKAAYPLPFVREQKVWPAVSRVDNAYGDRNLVCTCPPIEAYQAQMV